jgi:acetyl-CoA synthetase
MSQPHSGQASSGPSRSATADRLDVKLEPNWLAAISELRSARASPDAYRRAWIELFDPERNGVTSHRPIWFPDQDAREKSNIALWMRERECQSGEAFHHWTAEHRADFWSEAVRRVAIVFDVPAHATVDLSRGAENAIWFPGARLNIVNSCFQSPPDQTAIVSQAPGKPRRLITYRELRRQTNQVSRSIVQAGWRPGDRLAVVLPMTAWSVPLYLGIVQAGCAVVSIADSFAPEEIANRIRIADAKAVFTYDRLVRAGKSLPLYERVCQATDRPVVALPVEGDRLQADLRKGDQAWSDFLVSGEPVVSFEPESADAQACINVLFSSGTTGDPKAIVWNHLTGIKCAVDGFLHQDLRPGHVAVWPTNLGWMMGPWLIFATLINRGTIGLYEDAPLGTEFGRFVQDAHVRMLGVVPTIVKAWRACRCMEGLDWSRIHVFSSTGESSHPEDMFYLSSLAGMRPIIEYCGGTEIGGGYITSTVVQPNYAGAFNSPAAGLDFVILDDQHRPADEGELFLIPPSVGLSNQLLNRNHHETYFAGTPSTAEYPVLRRHGDHFRRIAPGVYAAGGRVDDTMNLGGIKISSAEIERVCNRVDGIKETAAVALADGHGPEQLVLFAVVLQPGLDAGALLKPLNQALRDHLNPLFKVSRVEIVEALPRTASNKIMRRLLRDQIQ